LSVFEHPRITAEKTLYLTKDSEVHGKAAALLLLGFCPWVHCDITLYTVYHDASTASPH